jgi:HEAT repeat protein
MGNLSCGWTAGVALFMMLPSAGVAQSLAQRVAALGNGTLRLDFAARPGVCGSAGDNGISIDDSDGDSRSEWERDCTGGPVRVSLHIRAGRVEDARTYVGGRWRPADARTTDLGAVPAGQAATELLALATRVHDGAEALMTAAVLADSATVWPDLLRLARSPDLPLDTRRHAVFWLGRAAGRAATAGLDTLARESSEEVEIRKQAVFALSQRPAGDGVPALIRIARTSPHPELRKAALFWLGESDDPRALALFEEILR